MSGTGNVMMYGAVEYAMRIWTDLRKLQRSGLAPGDIVAVIRAQSRNVAAVGSARH